MRTQFWLRRVILCIPRIVTGKFLPNTHSCFSRATKAFGLVSEHKGNLSSCAFQGNYLLASAASGLGTTTIQKAEAFGSEMTMGKRGRHWGGDGYLISKCLLYMPARLGSLSGLRVTSDVTLICVSSFFSLGSTSVHCWHQSKTI